MLHSHLFAGLEFKRTLQRNMIPSAAKQKQMLKKFYDIAGQVSIDSLNEINKLGEWQTCCMYHFAI